MSLPEIQASMKGLSCRERLDVLEFYIASLEGQLTKKILDTLAEESLNYIERKKLHPAIEAARAVA